MIGDESIACLCDILPVRKSSKLVKREWREKKTAEYDISGSWSKCNHWSGTSQRWSPRLIGDSRTFFCSLPSSFVLSAHRRPLIEEENRRERQRGQYVHRCSHNYLSVNEPMRQREHQWRFLMSVCYFSFLFDRTTIERNGDIFMSFSVYIWCPSLIQQLENERIFMWCSRWFVTTGNLSDQRCIALSLINHRRGVVEMISHLAFVW